MKIHELLDRDPRTGRLANNGQARITDTADAATQQELRAELESFVCDGQFRRALQLVLDRFLGNLSAARQDSAWISGFFGSGKSHLLKMLTHLWVNTTFDDGATARGLVRGGLPDDIDAQLRELDTQARRTGKPAVAAAGSMLGGNVEHVRLTVLAIVLRAAGWPAQYPQAMFCFWLRERGLLGTVRRAVEAAGRNWLKELNDLYVSPVIARALVQADPDFAADERGARQVLVSQYAPVVTDRSTEQFIDAVRKALAPDGQLPLTMIVLDEVQQYINDVSDRAATITELAEALQTQCDSRVMLVTAGQSALSAGTPALMWLRDRFRITIELTDADVETVTRKVLLRKKASAHKTIEDLFERHAGEVARHLQGTRIGSRADDRRIRVDDYPLLPVRRRFWEACFQAVDLPGTHSQLRSQLRIIHDSLHDIAGRDAGAAVPASDLFNALAPSLVNSNVLLNEINTRIQKLDDGTDEGRLCRDLCGLVFLIGKLSRQDGLDLGVRADAVTLADLMVTDLTADSGPFRKCVADTLERLAADGVLMKVGIEYRMQTTEGAEWDREFGRRKTGLRGARGEVEASARRDQLFGRDVQAIVKRIKLIQGDAKVRRDLVLHTGQDAPEPADQVMVWLRDGWSSSQRDVEREARRLGQDDPTIHVYLPKRNDDALRDRIVEVEAARQVLDHYGVPSSPEGLAARESMESRLRTSEAALEEIVRDLVRQAVVYQGGGTEQFGDDPAGKLTAAAEASLARLFPRFSEADHKAWEAALKRAKDGADHPFKVVGWDGATEEHPVAREALGRAASPVRGSEIRRALKAAPFGWPQDAIDAALIALHRAGHLRGTRNGQPIAAGALDQNGIGAAEFRSEKVRLSATDRIALRGLLSKLVTVRPGEEDVRAPQFLDKLKELAGLAGGEPPLPPAPDVRWIDDLARLAGSEQLAAILSARAQIECHIDEWQTLASRAAERRGPWELALALRAHAAGIENLDGLDAASRELDAIGSERRLLDPMDHVAQLVPAFADALRTALNAAHTALTADVANALAALSTDATWTRLNPDQQAAILHAVQLDAPPALALGTNDQLRAALDACPLETWRTMKDAVPRRLARALEAAASRLAEQDKKTRVTTVTIRRGTLADEAAVRAWVREHEEALLDAVRQGPAIVA